MQAFNFTTMTHYTGSNAALVGNGELPAFATFNQLKAVGYSVNKGAKSIAINCGFRKVEDKATGKVKSVPRFARVFDIIDTNACADLEFIDYLKDQIEKKLIKTPVSL